MTYASAESLRQALEHRLRERSSVTGLPIDRLRRRVLMERIVTRLEHAEPGRWVLKGGMALEVRLAERARLTKDIDLAMREEAADRELITTRLSAALTSDHHGDMFVFVSTEPELLQADRGRARDMARAGRVFPFGTVVRIGPDRHLAACTRADCHDRIALPNSLDFAGVPDTIVEVVELTRHAAEKFHGMTRDFGDRVNSRVRDLCRSRDPHRQRVARRRKAAGSRCGRLERTEPVRSAAPTGRTTRDVAVALSADGR